MPLTVERLRKARQIEYAIDKFLKAIDHKGKVMTMNNKLAETSYRYFLPFVDAWMKFTIDEINKAFAKKYINKSLSFEKDEAINITDNLLDWGALDNTGVKMLKPATLEIMANSGNLANKIAGIEGSFDIINPKTVEVVNKICSEAVKNVYDETKKAINEVIRQGLLDGKSMGKVAKELKPIVGLNYRQLDALKAYEEKLISGKIPLSPSQINQLVIKYENKLHNYRTDMIARTESMRAVNEGQRLAYSEEGYKTLIWSANAGACPQCAAENGQEYGIEEAEGIIPLHPDCRCTWLTGSKKGKVPGEQTPIEEAPRREHLEGDMPKNDAIKQFIGDAAKQGKIYTEKEAEEVYAAVKRYSGGMYKDIRSYQMNPKDFIELHKPDFVKVVKKASEGLDEFFKYSTKYEEKMIYRGIDLTGKEVALFKKGQIINMGGTSSFSSDPLTAARFGNVQFRLKNKTGVSIKHISHSSSENEIILPTNIKFKITKIKEVSKEIYDINIEEIL